MERATAQPAWAAGVDRAARWCLRHWLLCVNTLALVYAGVPWLAPLAKASGHPLLGELLFRIYTPLCHQKPERSFFVCGHQVAFCHRCTAMYSGLVVVGMLFALLRRYIPPAPLWVGGVLLLPMLLDGGTHLIDDLLGTALRGGGDAIGTLNFWLRMITGVLFAVAMLVTVYPRLQHDLRWAENW
ncbi:MAG TPA: DUF2085 domain-containing protein [Roseiflexaceae bacterium]|nr:DUF2085 domain-containing protein [Roseiflexaceae bacterium]